MHIYMNEILHDVIRKKQVMSFELIFALYDGDVITAFRARYLRLSFRLVIGNMQTTLVTFHMPCYFTATK